MKKALLCAFLIVIMVGGLALVGILLFGMFHGSTDVTGVISSDTTWTKANSPYSLTGPVRVNNEVTLTVEAGATLNLNDYYIQVDGTMVAKGTSDNHIQFNEGLISFTESSVGWNEQTGSGCIIKNAVLSSTSMLIAASPKLYNSSISGNIFAVDGSPIISNNTITGTMTAGGSSVISYNNILSVIICGGSSIISNNNIMDGIIVDGGAPTISHNNILCGSNRIGNDHDMSFAAIHSYSGTPTISYNSITIQGAFYASTVGINLGAGTNAYIHDNIISGFSGGSSGGIFGAEVGNVTIERNLITGNWFGIRFGTVLDSPYVHEVGSGNIIIKNNSITGNALGFDGYYPQTFIYNNVHESGAYNIKIEYVANRPTFNAAFNWWGTADEQSINQTFLGSVIFVPFLNESNPETTPNISSSSLPTLISTSTQSSSPTPTQSPISTTWPLSDVYAITIVLTALIVAVLIIVLFVRKKRKLQSVNIPVSLGGGEVY
jgi:hypothetical protein